MAVKTNYEKNGKKYYRITATIGKTPEGKLIRKEFYGKSKSEAEALRDDYLKGIQQGLSVDYKTIELGSFMKTWLYEILLPSGKLKPSSFDRYETTYRNYIVGSVLKNMKLSEIRTVHIQKFYNELYGNKKTPSTIDNVNKLLKKFFNYAISEDYILKNPCYKVDIPGTTSEKAEKIIEPFTDEEIAKIKKDLPGREIEMVVLLGFATGMRIGELLGLTDRDIDFKENEISISKSLKHVRQVKSDESYEYKAVLQSTKTKNSNRVVPIPTALAPTLKKHIQRQKEKHLKSGVQWSDSNFIFTTGGCGVMDSRNVLRAWGRCLKRCDIKYRSLHTIRHTYATRLFENGIPLKTVSILLGHSDIRMTANTYTHVMPKEKITAAETLNSLFF